MKFTAMCATETWTQIMREDGRVLYWNGQVWSEVAPAPPIPQPAPEPAPSEVAADALTQEQLEEMMRDPRYWRQRDPEFIARVTAGFRRLHAEPELARPAREAAAADQRGPLERLRVQIDNTTDWRLHLDLRAAIAEIERLRTVCGEVYQVVGVLAERWPDCSLARVLDNLSAAAEARPVPHATLLPFVAPASPKVAPVPVTEAMVEAAMDAFITTTDDPLADFIRSIITAALAAAPPDPLWEAVRDQADACEAYANSGDNTAYMRGATAAYGLIRDRLRAILETGRG